MANVSSTSKSEVEVILGTEMETVIDALVDERDDPAGSGEVYGCQFTISTPPPPDLLFNGFDSISKEERRFHSTILGRLIEEYGTMRTITESDNWEWRFTVTKLDEDHFQLRVAIAISFCKILVEVDPQCYFTLSLRVLGKQVNGSETSTYQPLEENLDFTDNLRAPRTFSKYQRIVDFEGDKSSTGGSARLFELIKRNSEVGLVGESTLKLICHIENVPNLYAPAVRDPFVAMKKMFEDRETFSDLVITTNTGSLIRCHKAVVTAQSDVLQAMLTSDCVEASSSTVKMEGMDDEGVEAFLRFLYCWDLKAAEDSCHVARQLLAAGHLYMIESLQHIMEDLLSSKPNEWFKLDDALEMYIVIQGSNAGGDVRDTSDLAIPSTLLRKLIDVIKSKGDAILSCPAFEDLFRTEPKLAMQFVATTLTFVPSLHTHCRS